MSQRLLYVREASVEPTPDLQLEIAHILLIDVVGYSKLLVNEQIELLEELKQIEPPLSRTGFTLSKLEISTRVAVAIGDPVAARSD